MRGFWGSLTQEQKKAALMYRGPESVGPAIAIYGGIYDEIERDLRDVLKVTTEPLVDTYIRRALLSLQACRMPRNSIDARFNRLRARG